MHRTIWVIVAVLGSFSQWMVTRSHKCLEIVFLYTVKLSLYRLSPLYYGSSNPETKPRLAILGDTELMLYTHRTHTYLKRQGSSLIPDSGFSFPLPWEKASLHIWTCSIPSRTTRGFRGGSRAKEPTCQFRRRVLTPELRRFPGVGNGNHFQYSCLENPTDRGAWRVTVHGVTESDTTEHARVL